MVTEPPQNDGAVNTERSVAVVLQPPVLVNPAIQVANAASIAV